MSLTLAQIEALAPDQASLKAAMKLMKPGKWPLRAGEADRGLIWGECQGSGANPYRVAVDLSDQGTKCTCPSRKFPCKHALALLWMRAEDAGGFDAAATPEWVEEWLGRRRKTTSGPKPAGASPEKSISAAKRAEAKAEEDPKAAAKRQAAAEKRAAQTREGVAAGLVELEQWIKDQLRGGLGAFMQELPIRCRRIAARLVDAKAAVLASRVDELPARMTALAPEERLDAAISELGALVLLARAWRADPENPALRRSVVGAESGEAVLENADAPRIASVWEVAGTRVSTRRDGLVSQATWLLNLGEGPQRFALLLDFFPASAGKRTAAFAVGTQFIAELAFYPAPRPLRALIAAREASEAPIVPWPKAAAGDPLVEAMADLQAAPWIQESPVLLGPGRLVEVDGRAWWRSVEGAPLPLAGKPDAIAYGADLSAAVGVWRGAQLDLLAAQSDLGRLDFDG